MMDNKLLQIIDKRVERKLSNIYGNVTIVPAVVTSVCDDYLRANVRLKAGGTELVNMLNKSGEKLHEGQEVRIMYQTLPSSGVIIMTNDEADPLKEGGGGGGGIIEHAAVLTSDAAELLTEHDLIPLDVGQKSQVYYGSPKNKFLINNGLTVIFAKNAAELLSLVKEEDLSALNVGIQNSSGTVNYYDVIPYSVSKDTASSIDYINTNVRLYMPSRSGYRAFSAVDLVSDSDAKPTFIKTLGVVFRAQNIYAATSTYPYGYVSGNLTLVFFDHNDNIFTTTTLGTASGTFTAISNTSQRFLSQAEYDFAVSITTRSELIEDGG